MKKFFVFAATALSLGIIFAAGWAASSGVVARNTAEPLTENIVILTEEDQNENSKDCKDCNDCDDGKCQDGCENGNCEKRRIPKKRERENKNVRRSPKKPSFSHETPDILRLIMPKM